MITERFVIGKITSAHGIRGEVKVFPITDNARTLTKLRKCFFCREDGTLIGEKDIVSSRVDRGNILILFEGVSDRDAAEKLRGTFLSVDRENAAKLTKDRFYISDLIGMKTVDDSLGELGVIDDVYETGANYVISVKRMGKKDLQIPFLKAVCYDVDIEGNLMKTQLPDGLYELYEPGARSSD